MLSTSKFAGGIDRELRTLVTNLEDGVARLIAVYPDAGVTVCKVPDRLILQAGDVGVSISLFRSRVGMEAGAEVIVSLWEGKVTIPGSAPRGVRRARQVSVQQFRIAICQEALWYWSEDVTSATMTSQDLAAVCIQTMANQLRPAMLSRQESERIN
jgi:hypothetical protein